MLDSTILEKTNNEPGAKVDFIPVSPLRKNATEEGELHEHGVDDESATDDARDGGGVEQGEQATTPQLRRSDR